MKYDFYQVRIDKPDLVYRGCIVRRFAASFIDCIVVIVALCFFAISEEKKADAFIPEEIVGLYNLCVLIVIFYLPEVLFRRSVGMWMTGLVVLAPIDRNPYVSIGIRKFMNLVEFALPSFVFYFVTSLATDFSSMGDSVSNCVVARKAVLDEKLVAPKPPGKVFRIFIAIVFSILPLLLLIGFFALLAAGVFTVLGNYEIFKYLETIISDLLK